MHQIRPAHTQTHFFSKSIQTHSKGTQGFQRIPQNMLRINVFSSWPFRLQNIKGLKFELFSRSSSSVSICWDKVLRWTFSARKWIFYIALLFGPVPYTDFFALKKLKKTPSKVAQKYKKFHGPFHQLYIKLDHLASIFNCNTGQCRWFSTNY